MPPLNFSTLQPQVGQPAGTSGDWWDANTPQNTGVTGMAVPGARPTTGGGDPQAIIAQWQDSHPVTAPDIPGLVKALQDGGFNAQQATHAGGQLSDDKFILNGGMWDVGSSLGSPGGQWLRNPQPDMNDPNANPNAQGNGAPGAFSFGSAMQPSSRLYNPNDLTAGWTQEFQAPSAEDAMNSPGIQAALKLGAQAIQRSAASKGTLLTGGTLKDLTGFANDVGIQAYGDVYGRAMGEHQLAQNTFLGNQANLFNRNFSLAQLGENAAANQGLQGANYANQATGQINNIGNAQSAGTIGSSNAWMPTLGALTNFGIDAATRNRTSY